LEIFLNLHNNLASMNFYDAHTHLNTPLLYPKHEQLIKNFINI